ncbi:putative peptidoglycan lipid II flippase [Desulfohalotomaculum tongense]|uniref:murein biosynthesis integral membrane protein MurJ n=1 Tax=Desulforadius tongensis TaxID=1216062 RepID=UPI00195D46B5|nr:murein biosynthesis integral membrane protein MurJ [Desulforadius tongensis]MBM7853683.1 putative peptidoglycan lipid II flippase [Desulforadius tongensis]
MSAGKVIARATVVIAVINLVSRLLGFVREMVIAEQFGATGVTDAYLVAYTIPYVLMSVLGMALATVVVPIFSEYESRGQRKEAWQLFGTVTNLTALIFIIITIIGIFSTPLLVKLLAPGIKDRETVLLAQELTRLMFPILVFMGLSTLFNGLLNANNIFAVPSFSVVASNIVVIISTLTLGEIMGVYGLAIGTVLGMVVAALIQLPALYRSGFRFRFSLDWSHPDVRKVMSLMLPVALGVSVNQAYIIVDRILASGLAAGSISALNFSNRLILLPIGLFVMAIGTAFYPTLTRQAVDPSSGDMAATLRRAFRIVVMMSVPSAVGLMVLRYPIIKLLFERGEFDARATEMTAYALLFFSIGLVGQAANVILTRGFYALQDTRTPVRLTVVTIIINLVLSLILIGPLQHGGLALANSIAALANTAMLSWFLSRRVKNLWNWKMVRFTLQVLLASGIMALAVRFVNIYAHTALAGYGTLGLAAQVTVSVLAGAGVFVLAAVVLRIEEAFLIFSYGKRFLASRTR